jgi:hypothetical protein
MSSLTPRSVDNRARSTVGRGGNRYLTRDEIFVIYLASGQRKNIAADFEVTESTVCHIKLGHRHLTLRPPIGWPPSCQRLPHRHHGLRSESVKRGSHHSAEAREKMSRAVAALWQDPDYRTRTLARLRAMKHKRTGRPKGSKNSPEANERVRQANIKRWQDPEYRARMLPHMRAIGAKGRARPRASRGPASVRPRARRSRVREYEKIARVLGAAARAVHTSAT